MNTISGKTKVVGIFGHPVEHSFSPAMHNAGFSQLEIDYCYVPFLVTHQALPSAVQAIRSLNLSGVNVTIPHKESVLEYLDKIDPMAKLIGAVNTIVNDNGVLIGYNTDGLGFYRSVIEETGFNPEEKNILILGNGGAARAVAVTLAKKGVGQIDFAGRQINEKIQQLTSLTNSITKEKGTLYTYEQVNNNKSSWDMVINTTPVGMYPHVDAQPLLDKDFWQGHEVVCDLIYNPPKTCLLKQAEAKGCRIMSGKGMLLYQGVIAFELWTSKKPPIETMAKILEEYYVRN